VIAIIGSSLIVTALTSLNSYINKPLLEIHVTIDTGPSNYPNAQHNVTAYNIILANKGNSPANDVRLTLTYPGVKLLGFTRLLENENLTLTKRTPNSAIVTLDRLSSGARIVVQNNVAGNVQNYFINPLNDFGNNPYEYAYRHDYYSNPFFISATYDQGSVNFYPPVPRFADVKSVYFDIDLLKFFIAIILASLLFAIAFRHKRTNLSKSASNVLADTMTVEKYLKNEDSRAIITSSKNHSKNDKHVPIFDNYNDLNLIDNFYASLKERETKLSDAYSLSDTDFVNNAVKEMNSKCFRLSRSVHSTIDWKKFYKLDLILLIPAIIMGSSFITLICEGVPYSIFRTIHPGESLPLLLLSMFIPRTIGAYFIIRWTLNIIQGSAINAQVVPLLSRRIIFFSICAAIMGYSSGSLLDSFQQSLLMQPGNLVEAAFPLILIGIDIGRMVLLIFVVVPRSAWISEKPSYQLSGKSFIES